MELHHPASVPAWYGVLIAPWVVVGPPAAIEPYRAAMWSIAANPPKEMLAGKRKPAG